ncbi:MAG: RHS repeat protein, partial [Ignavibacteriae bacterium]|nr:RHS repeat protein [Ignavibacteriota bacterium]
QPLFNNTKVTRDYDKAKLFRLKQQRAEAPEFANAQDLVYEDDFLEQDDLPAKSQLENVLLQGWSDPVRLNGDRLEFNNQYWTVRKISNVEKQGDYEQTTDIDLLSSYGTVIKLGMVGRIDGVKFYAATLESNYAYIYRVDNNVWTQLAKVQAVIAAQRYTSYKAKLKFSGNAIQFKVWKAADTEPINWTVSYADANAIKEGNIGLAGYYARTRFDNLKIYKDRTAVLEEVSYQDDFSQSQSTWQKIYSDGTWQTAPNIANGVLNLSNNNIAVYSLSSYQDLTDYEQTLDIGIRAAYNTSRIEAEIAGRVNADKFYLVRTANGTTRIYKYAKDSTGKWIPSILGQASSISISRYTDYRARLKFTGNKIQYKIWLASQSEPANWTVQADDANNPILSGKAGIASYNGSEVLDNLAIKYYQTKILPPVLEPTGKTIEIQNFNYLYDNVGNITQIEDRVRQEKSVYGYDDLYRLTSAQVLNSVNSQIYKQDFQYDSIGNILYKSDVGNYLYENQSQPMAVTKVAGTGYNYDLKGNLLNDGTRQYNWDTKNRLMQVTKGSAIIKYEYDNAGNRILKEVNGQKTFYVSQDYRILPDGMIEKEFSVGLVTFLIKKNPADGTEQIFTIYKDHLGSTSLMTDEQGKVVSNEVYYPYGDTREQTGDVKAARQFTGQINDVESGLYYYNARYYNANIGRFISVDHTSLYRP